MFGELSNASKHRIRIVHSDCEDANEDRGKQITHLGDWVFILGRGEEWRRF